MRSCIGLTSHLPEAEHYRAQMAVAAVRNWVGIGQSAFRPRLGRTRLSAHDPMSVIH